ncbi:hypothetical protein Mgra_00007977 [Meloidogyne graminicola]|uniref:Dolichyl-diphosphooligosaccharide-protein glycosyltransferase subunit TMEM258 n=1 Tax=Meloidogyne graminicola TaxID=189291 RepID=A0A8S9ZH37_9BILA|nr:hypothetical protein Mgra_00007977 [Meloidogyne graminicola]
MQPYNSPVSSSLFPHLTIILLGIGLASTAYFFVNGVTSNKKTRNIFKELIIALIASSFLGFGALFLMLWVGINV